MSDESKQAEQSDAGGDLEVIREESLEHKALTVCVYGILCGAPFVVVWWLRHDPPQPVIWALNASNALGKALILGGLYMGTVMALVGAVAYGWVLVHVMRGPADHG
jgi:hypothetical protein